MNTPSTSVQISQASASSAAAIATALASEPPLPKVVTSNDVDTPWNPATIAMKFSASAFRTRSALTSMILAWPWEVSVTIPAWEPVNEIAWDPNSLIAMDNSAIEMRSPAVSNMSISRDAGTGEI